MSEAMAWVAVGLYALFLGVAFGFRSFLLWRRTGSMGFHGVGGRVGSAEWMAGVLFVLAILVGLLAPVLQVSGVLEPVGGLAHGVGYAAGGLLAAAGFAVTVVAQQAMGSSWRVGVDPEEATELVTGGIFALARNPIFTGMITAAVGLALLAPNVLALGGVVALIVGVQLQVRVVEEPYLRRVHGHAFAGYAGRVGRFVPGVGRLTPGTRTGARV
ncbi:protein-S-isoprenylcysteine O-methyltransferase Ste14 [Saccharomonospora amisosensis]|uniref:Protein-S-isoprenylcysteine O-methyltransferase Ste14 n=1 Tax=Saccharomonospora amisosensis TaxID=1128677 RepID=A0A7X5UR34_9PSEU|nr:isoprenylcysteine carboxylmethyltransferase family protein [Saccharomonospora amisosensis]NIJ12647.1 protein-S-isoprenylcysteine O-methyltransferase Ste14 [Saccharomonospora amisosensis]